jgi:hypothetical protein
VQEDSHQDLQLHVRDLEVPLDVQRRPAHHPDVKQVIGDGGGVDDGSHGGDDGAGVTDLFRTCLPLPKIPLSIKGIDLYILFFI